MKAIETLDLTKQYATHKAVNQLNLSIREGELFALLGLNGAGKTTLINMLTTILAPTSGEATIHHLSIQKKPQQIKSLIGVSPQESAVAPHLTVEENILLMATIYGASKLEAKKQCKHTLLQLNLQHEKTKKAKHLSGGMMRRLSIGMALVTKPNVLFLDEPTVGVDVVARRELWNVIKELKGSMTIVLTTHHMEEADALADRIGIMANGFLIKTGTPANLKKQKHTDSLEDAFVSFVQTEEVPS
ncbi:MULTISPECIES: ABC transporter ATP-binding protein [Bacillaceae]|uniref:ABC transporter ATP-binding protein n=1 Tax=Alkalicoccobacillus plakortidis TaxID=444060 RepID=A0A9D5I038_9BACI|nr:MULTISPECIES: ABC transporter A family member [Bacillaceae]KQL56044.1 ABC transporter ATP-binding protein [Alkalicoccobacillus plakortidis]RQW22816.1 ATP-binding cassette domain-containing protein [Bacillus sp. C1-1]